ncbi:unnamed protein product, partial [Mesorhabditis belari]|uniref:Uncharacterized protein n=1 Tax=Mesorhabditis belari TaxID=2138241 RepID=A0AAF3EZT9_9BILA
MEKTRPRFEADQKETTYANETLVDSRSASLTINLPRPDSPEYDEISDTEIDQYVSKPLEEDAVHEMDFKFRVLKRTLEEYAVWCEIRIDPIVMMYFVHKFHTECALYMLQHYGIHVDVRRYENELIRRTEDPNWTDAQKLKRKVLQRRKSNSTKKKICAKRVGDVFNELLAGEFPNVVERDSFSIAKISALIECSKSKRDVFSRTLCKYDKYGELPGLLEKVLVNNWISFFYCLPLNGFGESDTLNEYERDELLCRNDNSQRTDAQNLKQKVLRRRKSNPLKKCLCSQKGERVLTELLKEDFEKVIGSKRITDEEIAKLIELSKSRWEFFFSTLQKYDRYCELRELMNRIFVKQWIDVISLLPNQGFAQADVLNHYRNACDTLELSIPNEKHSTLITVLEEYYKHKEEERVLEELLKRATTSQEARKSQTSEFYY